MPQFLDTDRWILDIGCGIGQTLIASNLAGDKHLVGIDTDIECLLYGGRTCTNIMFTNGTADTLPFRSECFDFIVSRVSLPYTNIIRSVGEMYRVLTDGGRIWMALHSFSMASKKLMISLKTFSIKSMALDIYTILNGVYSHIFQNICPFPFTNKYISFQTAHSIRRVLVRSGFKNILINISNHFIVTAYK